MSAKVRRSLVIAAVALSLAACATLPAGPSLQALPGSQKSPDQHAADDRRCLAFASEFVAGAGLGLVLGALAGSGSAQTAWGGTQQQFDRAYYACMYAQGHKVPVPANDVARYRAWFDSAAPRPGAATGN